MTLELQPLLSIAAAYGGVLSVVLSILIVGSLRLSPESWLGDYPKDIQEAYGPISDRAEQLKWVFGLPILALPLLFGAKLLLQLHGMSGGPVPFWSATLAVFVMGMIFNLVDLVLLDWLWFTWIQPDFVVLPGTEGLAGYKDYGFHFRAFLVGVILCAGTALILAGGYRLWAA